MEDKPAAATTVTVLGVEYRLRSSEDPEFTRSVARLVDERLRQVGGMQQTASQTQVAVMTLLNVTGELLRERARLSELEGATSGRMRELGDRVQAVLTEKR